ncbi:helix-turn-helix domain-containing protein [Aureispira anguillae]|uniref:Helix-turn-helix domain-containing protein n=1 Tax=Aureispira anguillae TaxID=2864201 RepID=A0A916DQW5_9BACT|nr:helix-turn-helix domain-containing protein [Aureispira anguillae]BDS10836.1 helix-turn-helix domain-containing protein [Aureispira anguillae]BDS10941.1 helix-turn-helix domain-containing protein [Aureispira anguillae]
MDETLKAHLMDLIDRQNEIIIQQGAKLDALEEEIEKGEIYKNNFVTTREVSRILGLKPRTIRKYNYDGLLTGKKRKKEGMLYFPLKQVMEYRRENFKHWAFFE